MLQHQSIEGVCLTLPLAKLGFGVEGAMQALEMVLATLLAPSQRHLSTLAAPCQLSSVLSRRCEDEHGASQRGRR